VRSIHKGLQAGKLSRPDVEIKDFDEVFHVSHYPKVTKTLKSISLSA
jgi:hypothetical protein